MIPEVNEAFKHTCKALLGSGPVDLEDCGNWLGERVPLPYVVSSALGGKEVWLPPQEIFQDTKFKPSRTISFDEIGGLQAPSTTPKDLQEASLKDVAEKYTKPIAYYVGNFRYQNSRNLEKVSGGGDAENVYYSEEAYFSVRNIGHSNYVLHSEYLFGCHNTPYSSFSIHAYNSSRISYSFEMDGCTDCTQSMFCHNSEGLQDCLFCFNAKNLKYALGNVEVGKEKYERIRKMLVEHIVKELKEKKRLDFDIYSIGKKRGLTKAPKTNSQTPF